MAGNDSTRRFCFCAKETCEGLVGDLSDQFLLLLWGIQACRTINCELSSAFANRYCWSLAGRKLSRDVYFQ